MLVDAIIQAGIAAARADRRVGRVAIRVLMLDGWKAAQRFRWHFVHRAGLVDELGNAFDAIREQTRRVIRQFEEWRLWSPNLRCFHRLGAGNGRRSRIAGGGGCGDFHVCRLDWWEFRVNWGDLRFTFSQWWLECNFRSWLLACVGAFTVHRWGIFRCHTWVTVCLVWAEWE